MSLGLRLALMVLVAAVPIFFVQVITELQLREDRREDLVQRVQTLADQIAARQNRFAEAARFLLTAISRLEEVQAADAMRCSRELKQIRTPFPEITGIGVVKADGWSICTSSDRTTPIYVGDRPYFQEALRTRTSQTSGHIVGRASGSGSFVFARPVLGDDGSVQVVIILAFSSETLSQDLNDPPLPEGAFAALLDREGTVVAHWPAPKDWVGRKLPDSGWQKAVLQRQRGVTLTPPEGAQDRSAVAYASMQPPTNLTVVAGQPIAPAFRSLDVRLWQELAFVGGVFLLAAMAAWLGAMYGIQRPIRALMDDADAVSRGQFEHAVGSGKRAGIPELRLLADHFRRMREALSARQKELEQALQHKEVLLKEVNHRVKNSLQLVASLFALQRSRIDDPVIRQHFEEASRRVSTVARVHQLLYQDHDVDSVSFDQFLTEMCDELASAMSSENGPRLQYHVSECRLPTDKAVPLALIVNELVFNAMKYAYPGHSSGMIRVDSQTDVSELTLTVADDGQPLPPDFDPAKSDGLGMRVVSALTKQLNGHLQVQTRETEKSFVVRIPI